MLRALIKKVESGSDLSRQEAELAMEEILSGRADEETIVALLTILRAKGETVGELVGFARAMRRHVTPVFPNGARPEELLVDTCGTGGDSSGTFNISTAGPSLRPEPACASPSTATARFLPNAAPPMCSRRWGFRWTFRRSAWARRFMRSGSASSSLRPCTPRCAMPCQRGGAWVARRSICLGRSPTRPER